MHELNQPTAEERDASIGAAVGHLAPERLTPERLTPDRQAALDRGLQAFDRRVAVRRVHRRIVRGVTSLAVVASLAWLAARYSAHPDGGRIVVHRAPLPTYVEIIHDDIQLAAELDRANACERIGRRGGDIYVVECTRPGR